MVYTGGIGMQKNILLSIFFSFIIISTLCSMGITPPVMQHVAANPTTIYVPDTYDTIQKAVDAANPYDTIIVRTGIYRESIFINKTLTLIGKDRNATIIDGSRTGNVVRIRGSDVTIKNFTIRNSGDGQNPDDSGIFLFRAVRTTIRNNILINNHIGAHLRQGSNNTLLIDNIILNNGASGIRLADNNNFNYIISNTLQNNTMGVEIQPSSTYNTLFHNNFILNKEFQARILDGGSNKWDDGIEGNYWSDYDGLDTTQPPDGIGDTDLPIWEDTHPIMNPWSGSIMHGFYVGSVEDPIIVKSNCTIASFNFNQSLRQISFQITGPSILYFFCNVSVPKMLLNATPSENWLVQLNKTDISAKSTIIQNTHTSIYFTYSLSTYEVRIRVVKAGIVDFTPYVIGCGVAIAVIVITIFVVLKKKRRH